MVVRVDDTFRSEMPHATGTGDARIVSLARTNGQRRSQSRACQYTVASGDAYTALRTAHDELEGVIRRLWHGSLPALFSLQVRFFRLHTMVCLSSPVPSLVRHVASFATRRHVPTGHTPLTQEHIPALPRINLHPALLDGHAAVRSPARLNLFRRWILKSFCTSAHTELL